jgi:hypothetical protein
LHGGAFIPKYLLASDYKQPLVSHLALAKDPDAALQRSNPMCMKSIRIQMYAPLNFKDLPTPMDQLIPMALGGNKFMDHDHI